MAFICFCADLPVYNTFQICYYQENFNGEKSWPAKFQEEHCEGSLPPLQKIY